MTMMAPVLVTGPINLWMQQHALSLYTLLIKLTTPYTLKTSYPFFFHLFQTTFLPFYYFFSTSFSTPFFLNIQNWENYIIEKDLKQYYFWLNSNDVNFTVI